jgi:hypothetical protein
MANILSVEDLKNFPEADLITNYICDRKKKGLYTLVLVSGLPGSGKSSQCCRLAELVVEKLSGKNTFTSNNITSNFLHFVRFVRDADPEKIEVVVVEEISVLFPSRRAMSGENVDLSKVLDTCRKRQVIIFANAPIWTSIDSHMRSMANVYIQAIKVYKKAGIVYSKCYRLQTDPRTGKTYTHNFKRNGREVNRIYTLACDKNTWAEYESKKDSFLDEIYLKAEARAIARKKKDDKLLEHVTPRSIQGLTGKELAIFDAVRTKGRTQTSVAKEMGVSVPVICRALQAIDRKMKDVLMV